MSFESLPPSRKSARERPYQAAEKAEKIAEIREEEEKQKEDSERVAESLLNDLEQLGIKCERCGSKNVKVLGEEEVNGEKRSRLFCVDCRNEWVE